MLDYLQKMFFVLSCRKRALVPLLLLFIFTSFLEVVGIGLIGPFVKLASSPDSLDDTSIFQSIYPWFGIQNTSDLIFILGIIIISIFCFKSVLYFWSRFYIFKFAFTQGERLASNLLKSYMYVPYTFHLQHNTAQLINNIINETNRVIQGSFLQLLNAISNIVIATSLLLLLAKSNIYLLISILGVLLPLFFILNLLRGRIAKWGKKRTVSQRGMIRTTNHALGSIKETRLAGCEDYFENEIKKYGHDFSRSMTLFSSSQLLPRISIETTLIIFLIGFICIYQKYFSGNVTDLSATLSVFALAAMRLIPSSSQFMQSIGQLQSSNFSLNALFNDLKKLESIGINHKYDKGIETSSKKYNNVHFEFTKTLKIDNISYRYPDSSRDAVRNITLDIKKGASVAFIGKSGAGKTTLADIILGLLIPTNGDIELDGKSIYQDLKAWQHLVGYIPQSIFLIDDTIERNIAFGIPDDLIDNMKLQEAIKFSQLDDFIRDLPYGINTQVGERGVRLSGGQRQRIGIARAIYYGREIIVLDEATSALDNETEKLISDAIHNLSGIKTLILIAHRLSTIEYCDYVYVLEQGTLVDSGTYKNVVLHT